MCQAAMTGIRPSAAARILAMAMPASGSALKAFPSAIAPASSQGNSQHQAGRSPRQGQRALAVPQASSARGEALPIRVLDSTLVSVGDLHPLSDLLQGPRHAGLDFLEGCHRFSSRFWCSR